jgi:hypothetical protein
LGAKILNIFFFRELFGNNCCYESLNSNPDGGAAVFGLNNFLLQTVECLRHLRRRQRILGGLVQQARASSLNFVAM